MITAEGDGDDPIVEVRVLVPYKIESYDVMTRKGRKRYFEASNHTEEEKNEKRKELLAMDKANRKTTICFVGKIAALTIMAMILTTFVTIPFVMIWKLDVSSAISVSVNIVSVLILCVLFAHMDEYFGLD